MKSTPLKTHIADDEDKSPTDTISQEYIGATIVETISKDPLMQRVGIILAIKSSDGWCGKAADICWQPSPGMPLTQPYRSLHILRKLNDYYFIKQE